MVTIDQIAKYLIVLSVLMVTNLIARVFWHEFDANNPLHEYIISVYKNLVFQYKVFSFISTFDCSTYTVIEFTYLLILE